MSLHTSTAVAPRRRRLGLVAAIAVIGATTVAIADQQLASEPDAIAPTSQAATTRYFDIEANKAISMRELGRHIAQQRANRTSRYFDIEANKAISMRELGRHIAQQRAKRTSRYDDIEANKAKSHDAR